MKRANNRKAQPTAADLQAAEELKRRWLAIPRDFRPTQDELGQRYGEGGSQSLISQYLTGHIPLNLRALLFFAREFGCAPQAIYPDMPGIEGLTTRSRARTERQQMTRFDREWHSFTPAQKRAILTLVRQARLILTSR